MTNTDDRGELAREIAHQLNNQLTALFGQIDLLSVESSDPATQARLASIREVAERLETMSRDLQAMGRETTRPATGAGVADISPARILVIEDDPSVLAVAVSVLTALGHDVIPARSGEEAEELAGAVNAPIDLILTDVGLPGRLGPDVVMRIRQQRPDARVLYATGDADRARRQAPDLASEPLLQKPYRRLDLARAVADALAN